MILLTCSLNLGLVQHLYTTASIIFWTTILGVVLFQKQTPFLNFQHSWMVFVKAHNRIPNFQPFLPHILIIHFVSWSHSACLCFICNYSSTRSQTYLRSKHLISGFVFQWHHRNCTYPCPTAQTSSIFIWWLGYSGRPSIGCGYPLV